MAVSDWNLWLARGPVQNMYGVRAAMNVSHKTLWLMRMCITKITSRLTILCTTLHKVLMSQNLARHMYGVRAAMNVYLLGYIT